MPANPDTQATRRLVHEGCESSDWRAYAARLDDLAARLGLRRALLGQPGGEPLCLFTPLADPGRRPRLLVASGLHGDEPAGPWGLLRFLERADRRALDACSLSLLPVVNVTGFRNGTRLNAWGEDPNRGYLHADGASGPSREGAAILAHAADVLALASDGFLACHEDPALACAYVYSLERRQSPGPFSIALREVLARRFPIHPDGLVDGCPVRDGIVFNHHDSSLEAWFMRNGSARAACTETPGQCAIDERIEANAGLIEAFVRCP